MAQTSRGVESYPPYRWTKAAVTEPPTRAKHIGAFAIRVAGQDAYDRTCADALGAETWPLAGGDLVRRLSCHRASPEENIPVPEAYRS